MNTWDIWKKGICGDNVFDGYQPNDTLCLTLEPMGHSSFPLSCRRVVAQLASAVPDAAAGEPAERERTGADAVQEPHPANAQRSRCLAHTHHHR